MVELVTVSSFVLPVDDNRNSHRLRCSQCIAKACSRYTPESIKDAYLIIIRDYLKDGSSAGAYCMLLRKDYQLFSDNKFPRSIKTTRRRDITVRDLATGRYVSPSVISEKYYNHPW